VFIVDQDLPIGNIDLVPFEKELECVGRRRDALMILSSYFSGEKVLDRPALSAFFVPLEE
jgi:hypothetical protein